MTWPNAGENTAMADFRTTIISTQTCRKTGVLILSGFVSGARPATKPQADLVSVNTVNDAWRRVKYHLHHGETEKAEALFDRICAVL